MKRKSTVWNVLAIMVVSIGCLYISFLYELIHTMGDAEMIERSERFFSEKEKTIAFVVLLIGCLWNLFLFMRQEQTNEKVESIETRAKNKESYYQPLVLDFSFSQETFDAMDLTEQVVIKEIPKLKLRFYQGFPIENKSFYASCEAEMVLYTEVKHDFEKFLKNQEEYSSSGMALTIDPTFSITDESATLCYSVAFHLITDFTQQKQLFMVMYVLLKPTEESEELSILNGYIFDSDYTLMKDVSEWVFMEDFGRLSEAEKSEASKVVMKYLPVYSDLLKKISEL